MPGFIFDSTGREVPNDDARVVLEFDKRYQYQALYDSEKALLCFNSYANYPHETFETEDYFCLFEGLVYNGVPARVAENLFSLLRVKNFDSILETVTKLDGEFVFVIRVKDSNRWYIINDHWGRLPVYYRVDTDGLICTREISYFWLNGATPSLSQENAAIQLMFGYTLQNDTPYMDVFKLPPNVVVEYKEGQSDFTLHKGFNLSRYLKRTFNPSLKDLNEAISKAISERVKCFKNPSLSLSGGLDSRLIAGHLAKNKQKIMLTTFERKGEHYQSDVAGAKQIASRLGFGEHHKIIAVEHDNSRGSYISRIKRGMNGLEMGFILPYLESISTYSDMSLTGDGGDKFLVDLRPYKKLNSVESLLSYIVDTHSAVAPKEAAAIFGIDSDLVIQKLKDALQAFDCPSVEDTYAAFLIRNRGMNWLFEGEDRNRYFLWSTSPFYAPSVVLEAMAFSMKEKENGELFKRLFHDLPGNLETVVNPNWKLPLSDEQRIRRLMFRQKLKSRLPSWLTQKSATKKPIREYLQLSKNESSPELFSDLNMEQQVIPEVFQRLISLHPFSKTNEG